MQCEFFIIGNNGPEIVMQANLPSAQPVCGDQVYLNVDGGAVVFAVFARQFIFAQTPTGGVTGSMRIQVTRIGSIPTLPDAEESSVASAA